MSEDINLTDGRTPSPDDPAASIRTFNLEESISDNVSQELIIATWHNFVVLDAGRREGPMIAVAQCYLDVVQARQVAAALMDAADHAEAQGPHHCENCAHDEEE